MLLSFFRERFDLVGDDGEPVAGIASPGSLDGGVEREQIRLVCDVLNDGYDVVDPVDALAECGDILRDISAAQAHRDEQDRQHKRLKEVLAALSQDLPPLQTAQGAAQLARDRGQEQHFDRLERALDQLNQLIEEVLTLANHSKRVEETSRVNVSTVARHCWEQLDTNSATFEITDDVIVTANRGRLRYLLRNLLTNALTHGGSNITVRLGRITGRAGFYIADDGPGIPEDIRTEVFDPGYTTADSGTGFGLSIMKRAVNAHGWNVAVTESADGGARFEITGVDST